MRIHKLFAALFLMAICVGIGPISADTTALAQQRRRPGRWRPTPKPSGPTLTMAPTELKVLADVQHAGVADPFVAVAYNADTYKLLRDVSSDMPEVNAEVFKSRAVVAVFLGRRPTGGYYVDIDEVPGGLRISERQPRAGTMVAQVLSSPLKVVSVPVTSARALNIQVDLEKGFNAKDYRVSESDFRFTGGIAGRQTKFSLDGTLRIMRHEKLVSVLFDLQAVGADKPRKLHTVATGVVDAHGNMLFGQVDPGTLIEFPYAPLRAEGSWTDYGVWFAFDSLPPTVTDGFEGKGTFKAKEFPSR